jgi:hypothetical protein
MMLATTNRIGFWKCTELKRMKGNGYTLGEPWCEPIVFQGIAVANFVNDGAKVILVSGGSFRSYESARAWEFPINENCCRLENHSAFVSDTAPDWLLDVANVIAGSGRESEGDTEDRQTQFVMYTTIILLSLRAAVRFIRFYGRSFILRIQNKAYYNCLGK